MKLPNRYLKKIAAAVGESDTRLAIRLFISRQRSASESLEGIARRLGVEKISDEPLPFEGGLFRDSSGRLIIKLNACSSLARRRFTLAHEIGHLLLGTVPGLRSAHGSDIALERTCDSIAAELLMPYDDAFQFISNLGSPSPEKLRTIATHYAVSLRVAAIRVHDDLQTWKCCVGLWDCNRDEIRTNWFVGRRRWDRTEPDAYSVELALSSQTCIQTQELWPKGAFTDTVSLKLLRISPSLVLGTVGFVPWR